MDPSPGRDSASSQPGLYENLCFDSNNGVRLPARTEPITRPSGRVYHGYDSWPLGLGTNHHYHESGYVWASPSHCRLPDVFNVEKTVMRGADSPKEIKGQSGSISDLQGGTA